MSENPFAVIVNKRSFHRTEWNVMHTPTHTVVAAPPTTRDVQRRQATLIEPAHHLGHRGVAAPARLLRRLRIGRSCGHRQERNGPAYAIHPLTARVGNPLQGLCSSALSGRRVSRRRRPMCFLLVHPSSSGMPLSRRKSNSFAA